MKKKHYHYGAGLHGYLYQDGPYTTETYREAVNAIIEAYKLSRRKAQELRQTGSVELSLERDGNEYAEITECQMLDCDEEDMSQTTPGPWECKGTDGEEWVISARDKRGKSRTLAHVYHAPNVPLFVKAPEMRNSIEELADLLEAVYGRDIESATQRGDATKEEWKALTHARALLAALEKGA